jgi:hypothetical protein
LAVFTLNPETAKTVRGMKIKNVVINPKPKSAKVTTIYDEAETFAPSVREGE